MLLCFWQTKVMMDVLLNESYLEYWTVWQGHLYAQLLRILVVAPLLLIRRSRQEDMSWHMRPLFAWCFARARLSSVFARLSTHLTCLSLKQYPSNSIIAYFPFYFCMFKPCFVNRRVPLTAIHTFAIANGGVLDAKDWQRDRTADTTWHAAQWKVGTFFALRNRCCWSAALIPRLTCLFVRSSSSLDHDNFNLSSFYTNWIVHFLHPTERKKPCGLNDGATFILSTLFRDNYSQP